MPLVKIDLIKGRLPTEVRKLADIVQQIMESHFAAPEEDRYQIITQHEPYEMICSDTKLGLTRTNELVFIQIFQQGRDAEKKQALYAELMSRLGKEAGLKEGDLIVTCVANTREDWSFGKGRAQFLVGDL